MSLIPKLMSSPIRLGCSLLACWSIVWLADAAWAQQAATSTAPGAVKPALWSLAPVVRPEAPRVSNTAWPRTAVDPFILAGLEAKSWQPAAPIARERLIRRAYFDLWGLPPSPEEVSAFVADASSEAYERLIDRLLASPHYGERWARYWLDLVRFAETNGYERNALKQGAWQYRDWVIQSLNDDKPYDRFVIEQLAGDELADASDQTRIATGFLRIGTFDDEPNDPLKYKFEQLDDLIHATSTTFLAVTLKCARCHDHKFDPIPQTDYYAMLNFFIGGKAAEGPLLAYTDAGPEAPAVQLLLGGDPTHPGAAVAPGYLSMVPAVARAVDPPVAGAKTTGRRLQLARWIANGRNPLTARVMVNRLWQHHFGEGLVRTPDNFGKLAADPTHPQLLDWLASEFVEGGWRIKRMHKLIMLSAAYQMDSSHPREAEYAAGRFCQWAVVAAQSPAAGGGAAARRDVGGQRAVERESRRAEFLSARHEGSAGRSLQERGRVGQIAPRRAAPAQHLHDDQALAAGCR